MSRAAVSEAMTQPRSRRPRTHGPTVAQTPEHQGAHPVRVAGGVEGALVHEDQGEGAAQHGQDATGRLGDGERGRARRLDRIGLEVEIRVGIGGGVADERVVTRRQAPALGDEIHECGDNGGIRRGPAAALSGEVLAGGGAHRRHELAGVGEVTVVGQGQGGAGDGAEHGLSVLPGGGPGGGVADVPDGEVPRQGGQGAVVEDLGDQAEVLVDQDVGAVGGGDAGGLLAAVLEGVEPEVGQAGDLLAGGPYAEDATLLGRVGLELGRAVHRCGLLKRGDAVG